MTFPFKLGRQPAAALVEQVPAPLPGPARKALLELRDRPVQPFHGLLERAFARRLPHIPALRNCVR